MTRTKKGFLKAGAIIGIVAAALIGILGMICFAGQTIVDRDFVVQTTFNCKENEYTTIENFDGSFTYKYVNENGGGYFLRNMKYEIETEATEGDL